MTDRWSVELLAFIFASRTFAYRRLAHGLSRALSAFSSFMREYLDPVIEADQCAQYIDDFGNAAKTSRVPLKNYHTRRSSPARPYSQNLPCKNPLPIVKETNPKVHQIRQLLSELHTATFRKASRYV